jgi:hypothetical protein
LIEAPIPDTNAEYTFSIYVLEVIHSYLLQFFSGAIYAGPNGTYPTNNYVQTAWSLSSELDSWISNTTFSLTNVIKRGEQAYDSQYDGTAFALGVNVRWYWLSLPLAFSLLFLTVNIVRTSKSRIAAWKGGPLPVLFCDVEPEVKRMVTSAIYRLGELMDAVGKTKIVLSEEVDGVWMFKAV